MTRDLRRAGSGQPGQRGNIETQDREVDTDPASLLQVASTASSLEGPNATPRAHGTVAATMTASDFRVVENNTLRGFFTLELASGLVLHECALHESGEKRWVALPAKADLDAEGRQRRSVDGKKMYKPVVTIPDRARRNRFQKQALEAVDRLLIKGERP